MAPVHNHKRRALIIGYLGGVGQAVLSLLQQSDPGQVILEKFDEFLLIDQRPHHGPIPLGNARTLKPMRIQSPDQLRLLIREYKVDQVIDLSSLDTLDCTRICDEEGVDFLCTSVEEWPNKGSIPTDQAISRILPPLRPQFSKQSHLVGSGANPGIVNALAFAAVEEFSHRVNVEPTTGALDLHSIFITEIDTTREPGVEYDDDVFPMTWSPAHCLEELFEPRAFLACNGRAVALGHRPTERLYRARCGDQMIHGWVVPHEETKTLAQRFRDIDIAFIYQIPEAARSAIAAQGARRAPVNGWSTRRLAPPESTDLIGYDRIGVLLCSRSLGEFWMGFNTNVTKGLTLGTNATQLQVAAGVIAGWNQLGLRKGIHFVEDLDWRLFLATARRVLGEPVHIYDPSARPLGLAKRAIIKPVLSDTRERQYA